MTNYEDRFRLGRRAEHEALAASPAPHADTDFFTKSAAEHDLHLANFNRFVGYLEQRLSAEDFEDATDLLHMALDPVHAARRYRERAQKPLDEHTETQEENDDAHPNAVA
jgi:hypothetical protein